MTKLTIGIVGFGNFGQFLGETFAKQGHRIIGQSRGDYTNAAKQIGCEYVRSADELMDQNPQVVIFCTSIMSLHTVISRFPVSRLKGVLVADVLSVKMYPHDLLLKSLPATSDIVCTHPMFGPESGRFSWKNLPFVYEIVRVNPQRKHICDAFIDIWNLEQCAMVPMSCSQHDSYAASTQFITHTTGRMLKQLDVKTTPINTKGFESLLGVVDTTSKDSFDLFYGLFKYNPNARAELDKLELALQNIRFQLEQTERDEAKDKKTNIHTGKREISLSEQVLQNLIRRASSGITIPN